MDFTLPPEIEKICNKLSIFIEEEVLPLEADKENYNEFENIKLSKLAEMRKKAKAEGLWAPQMPKSRGGLELPISSPGRCSARLTLGDN